MNNQGDLHSRLKNLISRGRNSISRHGKDTQVYPTTNESRNRNRDSVVSQAGESVSEYDIYDNHATNLINDMYKGNSNSNLNENSDNDSNSDDDESTSEVGSKSGSMNTDDKFQYQKKSQLDLKRFTEKIKHSFTNGNVKRFFRWLLEYAYFEIHIAAGYEDLLLLLTFFVLLAPSIAYLAYPKTSDYGVSVVMTICFAVFISELVISTYSKTDFGFATRNVTFTMMNNIVKLDYTVITWKGHFLSKLWFLELIMVVSIFPEVPAISDAINFNSINFSFVSIFFIRMLRVLRVIKAYLLIRRREKHRKAKLKLIDQSMHENNSNIIDQIRELETNNRKPSNLSDKLSDSITTRVVVLIVMLLIITPLFINPGRNYVIRYSADFLQSINQHGDLTHDVKTAMINIMIKKLDDCKVPSIFLEMSPYSSKTVVNDINALNELRDYAIVSKLLSSYDAVSNINYFTNAEYSIDTYLRLQAGFTIVTIIVVCIVSAVATYAVNNDIANLVLKPITRMMNVVEEVGKNPLAKLHFKKDSGDIGSFETDLLENIFVKIAGLLRVGFGEAGAGIIKANLAINDSCKTAIINPLLPGVRVYCIVGFCDIHRFDFVLKRLGQDVLVFVNTVAGIVHENVHQWEGSCNKNLGNAFVLIWRIGDEETLKKFTAVTRRRVSEHAVNNQSGKDPTTQLKQRKQLTPLHQESVRAFVGLSSKNQPAPQDQHILDLKRLPGVDHLAAKALIGFLKIISELNTNESIYDYHLHPKLQTNGRDFDLHMGFGLHAGWAIEGAVGSLQKVDATYLSPHINMAARLETASRQYGVPLLVSQDFYELLSPFIHTFMRRLDVVTVKGSENPIGIYTYDVLPVRNTGATFNKTKQHRHNRGSSKSSKSSKAIVVQPRRGSLKGFVTHLESLGEHDDHGTSMKNIKNDRYKGRRTGFSSKGLWTNEDDDRRSQGGFSPASRQNHMLSPAFAAAAAVANAATVAGIAEDGGGGEETKQLSVFDLDDERLKQSNASPMNSTPARPRRRSIGSVGSVDSEEEKLDFELYTSKETGTKDLGKDNPRKMSIMLGKAKYKKFQKYPVMTSLYHPDEVFGNDRDLVYLRSHVVGGFLTEFGKGMKKYVSGEWLSAKEIFERCDCIMKLNPETIGLSTGDGPSQTLLTYMRSFGFVAPPDWQGYRPLTSK